ncbi:MAG: redoxin domain-containing protein [Aliifodinibius sp.]|nr:glutathione peroxidase [candidate division Zixibacteria bacterium]NIT55027.1 glutathione peroxidase [Fodinibius sp.]NIW39474.1 redoxin domain-containing protein [candidate division Zixibacteria bacterium]NIX54528.1 redoxin domain-containing protein [candidate division Zixibacteria bacterium]NIY23611.1 redoxin domain-containing protein [Fodinibius sp.]
MNHMKIQFNTILGDTVSLEDYKGNVVMIVNVASECGNTPQYADLEKLYQKYEDEGLVVIGFPSNSFNQEPGTDEQIYKFCTSKFDVTFPMMSKVSVKGEDKHPLFVYLTEDNDMKGEIKWNFEKFILDKDGNLVARFATKVNPLDDEVVAVIEKELEAE